jgi:putative transposase
MPWKETCAMEERMKFVLEVLEGFESKAALCRIYGISRPTGDKWLGRYAATGVDGLRDVSRAPVRHPNTVTEEAEAAVLTLRAAHMHWGPKKLLALLERKAPDRPWPSASTIGEILKRHGLTMPQKRRRRAPPQTAPFAACDGPNALWCADFKGYFETGDGLRCYPLTVTDACSRYVLRCQAADLRHDTVRPLFEATFREYGLPAAIRTDNGGPFASRGLCGLSRLSVWWMRLGIVPERIDPGEPQQNGRHERMHRTLKQETTHPPGANRRAQQRLFDRFRHEFNEDRPHEALGQATPASMYVPSRRPYPARLQPVEYPGEMTVRAVQKSGEFYWKNKPVFLGEAFGHERIGLERLDELYWTVHFTTMALGVFDVRRGLVLTWKQAAKVGLGAASPAAAAPRPEAPSPT